jgi:hypothetical protein
VLDVHRRNHDSGPGVPDLPEGTKLVRIHVSGDFDSVAYVERWIEIASDNPETLFWAYTRSWRDISIRLSLEKLRALPNVQLFASTDESITESLPYGWRVAWIQGDPRANSKSLTCPEETGKKANCEECGYCFKGRKGDVTFLRH